MELARSLFGVGRALLNLLKLSQVRNMSAAVYILSCHIPMAPSRSGETG